MDREEVNATSQIVCVWAGILCPLFLFAGLWPAMKFIPPLNPAASAAEIATIFQNNTNGIRLGSIFIMIAGALYAPFTAVIAAQMRRIERGSTPVLTYSQLAAGAASCLLFIIPGLAWTIAAFRPERPPEITQAFNDFAWIFVVMPFVLAEVQNICFGAVIISDKRTTPLFPRWLGFFNFWIALSFIPGGLTTFFKTGPFAYNGLLAFWIPAGTFGPWFIVICVYLIKAIRRQQAEGSA